jgi:hypothetical protein
VERIYKDFRIKVTPRNNGSREVWTGAQRRTSIVSISSFFFFLLSVLGLSQGLMLARQVF